MIFSKNLARRVTRCIKPSERAAVLILVRRNKSLRWGERMVFEGNGAPSLSPRYQHRPSHGTARGWHMSGRTGKGASQE